MRRKVPVRRVLTAAALTLIWCGLWGSVSLANVASGLALSVVVLAAGRAGAAANPGGIRVGPLLRFAWLVVVDLARSTVDVAVEILTPTDRTGEAIIAVDLPDGASDHLLLLSAAITLSPGTAVVEADSDAGRLYLHLLHVQRRREVEVHVRELADLACAALPNAEPGAEA